MLNSPASNTSKNNHYNPKLSERFRKAACDGNRGLVRQLFPMVVRNDDFGIDVKIALDLAAGKGHLPVVKYLYHRLDLKYSAMSGLFEAARSGMILTVKWLLAQPDFAYPEIGGNRDPQQAWQEGLSTAIRIAATNEHWGTMLELMSYAKQYIKDRIKLPEQRPLESQDLLLIESSENLSVSTIYIPSSSHIPKPLFKKINNKDSESKLNNRSQMKF